MTRRDRQAWVLYALALIMAVWDGGQESGKLLVAALMFVAGLSLTLAADRGATQGG